MPREIPFRYLPHLLAACTALVALASLPGAGPAAEDQVRASATCLECHGGMDSTLAGSPHWLGTEHDGAAARSACTDCHAGDRRHWEDDPAKYPMTNPAKVGADAEARLCATCHQNSHQQNMAERNVHRANDVSCSDCHGVHGAKQASLLKRPEPELCFGCHARAEGQFAQPYRHPVAEGVLSCTDCHAGLDRTASDLTQNGTNQCLSCHAQLAGPFPYAHQATLDHSTEEGGCLSCHEAHGGAHPRMLRQPYEPPHYQLCTQCHSVPRHFSNSMHGTTWATYACNDCHVDIHGSYDNRLFATSSLQAQGCFNSGCHRN